MNTKIMLTLCAMIAGCTSVSAVDSTTSKKQAVKVNLSEDSNLFVSELISKIIETNAKLQKQSLKFNNISEMESQLEVIDKSTSALDDLTEFLKKQKIESQNLLKDIDESSGTEGPVYNPHFNDMNIIAARLETILSRALLSMNGKNVQGDYPTFKNTDLLTFKDLKMALILRAHQADIDGDSEDANKIIELLSNSLTVVCDRIYKTTLDITGSN